MLHGCSPALATVLVGGRGHAWHAQQSVLVGPSKGCAWHAWSSLPCRPCNQQFESLCLVRPKLAHCPSIEGGTAHMEHISGHQAQPAVAWRPSVPLPGADCCSQPQQWMSNRSLIRHMTPSQSHAPPAPSAWELVGASLELVGMPGMARRLGPAPPAPPHALRRARSVARAPPRRTPCHVFACPSPQGRAWHARPRFAPRPLPSAPPSPRPRPCLARLTSACPPHTPPGRARLFSRQPHGPSG